MENKSICPYCAAIMEKRPVRKTKCKSCKNYIYIKYSPSNRNKRLVTESEAKFIDAEWERHYDEEEILRLMNYHNQNIEDIEQIRSNIGNVEVSANQVEIEILFKVLQDPNHIQNNIWKLTRLISLLTDLGKDTLDLQVTEKKYELREIICKGFKKIEIFCSSDCIHYKNFNSLKLTALKEFEHPRIPTRNCTIDKYGDYKVCMCSYKPYFED